MMVYCVMGDDCYDDVYLKRLQHRSYGNCSPYAIDDVYVEGRQAQPGDS